MTELEQKSEFSEYSLNQFKQINNRYITLQEEDSFRDLVGEILKSKPILPLFIYREQLVIEDDYEQDFDNENILSLPKAMTIAFSCSHFLNLKKLNINESRINNIEFMTFFDAPALQQLHISSTYIVNVKSLNKTNFKNLVDIRLGNSPVSQLNLSRMRFSASQSYLFLQQQDYPQITVMQDLSQLVKLQTQWLYQLFIQGENRISQQNLTIFQFQKRFHTIDNNKTTRSIQIYEQEGLIDFDNVKQ